MRTIIDLPDPLFRQAKARAALDGTTFKAWVTRCVQQGLRRDSPMEPRTDRRSTPPLARPATGRTLPVASSAGLHRILDEE